MNEILNNLAEKFGSSLFAFIRIGFGLLWLEGALWKIPPDFGKKAGDGLYFWVNQAIEFPVFGPYTVFVESVVLPNFVLFGWLVLITEALLALGFIFGIFTRWFAIIAAGMTVNIALSAVNAPHEWYWAYIMMLMLSFVFFANDTSDSKLSIDHFLNKRKDASAVTPDQRNPENSP